MPQKFTKDPSSILDYQIDWSDWLVTDAISTSTWTVPTGITKVSDSKTTTTATIWLSGGTVNTTYTVTNQIVTTGVRTAQRSIFITIRQR